MKLNTYYLYGILVVSFLMISSLCVAGPVIGGTRVIYNSGKKETSISIKNEGKDGAYLIQSWVEPGQDTAYNKAPFIVTPPLFRIDQNEENILRIVYTGSNLPTDRESVFWLNVKTIPAMDSSMRDENTLKVVVKSRIKIFYRPENLPGNSIETYKKIQLSRNGNILKIRNDTPYYISFYKISVAGKEIKDIEMISPKSSIDYSLSSNSPVKISWQTINDYGGISPVEEKTL
ncbi:fimbria/pilus periplasmic chaperone [Providencia alcalifaciens]|uniref:fimbrial biogenesis chaperone n=1 Tax=Providencia TaxID=586 RepID=UPI0012B5CE8A|nr:MULTISPECIES: molecular chaperone [Providencia]MTC48290.1 fimbria/pilus periplasmic chaperone [Providencia alcalifaciens]